MAKTICKNGDRESASDVMNGYGGLGFFALCYKTNDHVQEDGA